MKKQSAERISPNELLALIGKTPADNVEGMRADTLAVLKQAELGVPVAELIRQVGITEQTLYRWKKQYKGLETDQVRQFKQLQDENARLKRLVAELSLDKTMLQDVLAKKL